MNSELAIDSTSGEVHIALLEDKRLVELSKEKKDNNYSVGDVYLGRIKKIMPSLNAAFVDVGYEKDAFLHYLDLGPQVKSLMKYVNNSKAGRQANASLENFQLEKDIEKTGRISQVLTSNQLLPVQIAKEPISTKGPRITADISLAGRFVVLVPFGNVVSISSKIKSAEERTRLKKLAHSIKPKNFSLIIRTVADGKKVAELDKDIQDLLAKWNQSHDLLKTAEPAQKILGELNRTSTILRDMLNPNFNAVHVNDVSLCEEIKTYLKNIAPEQQDIVKFHKGKLPIFETLGLDKQIKSLFGKTVNLPNGAYLIIEHTEAMHVIDVNSGGRNKSGDNQENNALQVNLAAAKEVARQLRLRDMGGIIIIDFIDLHTTQNRKELFECLKSEMKKDRARHTVLPPSKFGLIQLTRERVRPEMQIATLEKCPACDGSGEIKSSMLFMDDIDNNISYFIKEQNEKNLNLKVHPYLEAYLKKGLFSSPQWKWYKKYKRWIKVEGISSYHLAEYHFFKDGEEIKI